MPIDSYRYLDFTSRQVMKAWTAREEAARRDSAGRHSAPILFTPLAKPLGECTVALLTTAGDARRDDRPFDQEGERRNPGGAIPQRRRPVP